MAYPIDIEAELLELDGEWYTRDELARLIRRMLDVGDYAVGRQAHALEVLTHALASLRTLAFRIRPEMLERLNQEAARQGRSVGGVVRDAIAAQLGLPRQDMADLPRAGMPPPPPGRRPTDPEVPSAAGALTTQVMELPLIDDLNQEASERSETERGSGPPVLREVSGPAREGLVEGSEDEHSSESRRIGG